jgi:hypothetical protein
MPHSARCAIALLACTAIHLPTATAQDAPSFATPVRLMAGDQFLGHNRLFPSPVFHDMNGDGLRDLVIGDLRGRLTIALRLQGEGPARFGAETKLLGANGKELDFANW